METVHSPGGCDNRSKPELAEIFKLYIEDYLEKYKLHPDHYKVIADVINCRTSVLGGHQYQCDSCNEEKNVFNSCRNRHCPKCQTMAKERWLMDRKSELLPVKYFHSVFTLPHEINPVALCNKRVIYGILFSSVSETLQEFGRNPQNGLGGKIGMTSILHTWDQKLNDHIHLHCLVPGGALSDDEKRWINAKSNFMFSVRALSTVFRGKFIDKLRRAYQDEKLKFPGKIYPFGTQSGFHHLIRQLWSKKWVVYAKKPFSGPQSVLEYIARYTHRIAISNYRIQSCGNNEIKFKYRDRKANLSKTLSLTPVEFIRRFLIHVVPQNFMRIRHFGLIANRCKKENIKICRSLLGLNPEPTAKREMSVQELMLKLTGNDINQCPFCKKGKMVKVCKLPELRDQVSFDDIKLAKAMEDP